MAGVGAGAGHRDRVRSVGVLAHLQPQPVVLDLELGKLVLAHEVENLFDLL